MLVALAVLQLILNGLVGILSPAFMLFAWWGSALLVGVATYRIEKYFVSRRRFLP